MANIDEEPPKGPTLNFTPMLVQRRGLPFFPAAPATKIAPGVAQNQTTRTWTAGVRPYHSPMGQPILGSPDF